MTDREIIEQFGKTEYWGRAGSGILYICPADGTIFLQKRSEKVSEPGTWGITGGAVESSGGRHDSEDTEAKDYSDGFLLASARREFKEELGVEPPAGDIMGTAVYRDGGFKYTTFVIAISPEQKAALTNGLKPSKEVRAIGWFALGALPDRLHFGVNHVLRDFDVSEAMAENRVVKSCRSKIEKYVSAVAKYNPEQPRDDKGRWTSGGTETLSQRAIDAMSDWVVNVEEVANQIGSTKSRDISQAIVGGSLPPEELDGDPDYLYHSTFTDRISSIARHGLLPAGHGIVGDPHWGGDIGASSYGKVFFDESARDAGFYTEIIVRARIDNGQTQLPDVLFLRVARDRLPAPAQRGDGEWFIETESGIPAENIEIWHQGKWKRLTAGIAKAGQSGVLAVDLDGTLAESLPGEFERNKIGPPVPEMLRRVKDEIASGRKVVIFTARAADPRNIPAVKAWLEQHGLGGLEVTNAKDCSISEIWDDRARQVVENTGEIVGKPDAEQIPEFTGKDAEFESEHLRDDDGWFGDTGAATAKPAVLKAGGKMLLERGFPPSRIEKVCFCRPLGKMHTVLFKTETETSRYLIGRQTDKAGHPHGQMRAIEKRYIVLRKALPIRYNKLTPEPLPLPDQLRHFAGTSEDPPQQGPPHIMGDSLGRFPTDPAAAEIRAPDRSSYEQGASHAFKEKYIKNTIRDADTRKQDAAGR